MIISEKACIFSVSVARGGNRSRTRVVVVVVVVL